jgi:twitching motility protein PilT
MNRSQEILDYLANDNRPCSVVLAPNAPPVMHSAGEVRVILSLVLSSGDVFDTLLALKSQSLKRELDANSMSGAFSFGLRKVGRIRVTYLTQRGSKVVSISRIPFDIPSLESLCEDPATAAALLQVAQSKQGGIVGVSGPDPVLIGTLVYSVLDSLNRSSCQIVGIVENPLTYLMAHRNSIIMQCEVGTDCDSIKDGVEGILLFAPEILYVGGVRSLEDLSSLGCAAQPGRLFVIGSNALDAAAIVDRFSAYPESTEESPSGAVKTLIRVSPRPEGKIAVRIGTAVGAR